MKNIYSNILLNPHEQTSCIQLRWASIYEYQSKWTRRWVDEQHSKCAQAASCYAWATWWFI